MFLRMPRSAASALQVTFPHHRRASIPGVKSRPDGAVSRTAPPSGNPAAKLLSFREETLLMTVETNEKLRAERRRNARLEYTLPAIVEGLGRGGKSFRF